jgi:hypothetical protein
VLSVPVTESTYLQNPMLMSQVVKAESPAKAAAAQSASPVAWSTVEQETPLVPLT